MLLVNVARRGTHGVMKPFLVSLLIRNEVGGWEPDKITEYGD